MGPTWGQLGANLGPRGGPRRGPEGSEIALGGLRGPRGHLEAIWVPFGAVLGGQLGVEICAFSDPARRYFRVKDVEPKSAETSQMEGRHFEEVTKKRRKRYEETSRKVTKLSESPSLRTSRSKRAARACYALNCVIASYHGSLLRAVWPSGRTVNLTSEAADKQALRACSGSL